MSTPTIRSQSLKRAIDRLDDVGADADRLLMRFGFNRRQTLNPLRRISFQKFVEFYEAAAEIAGDPHLGLHIGEYTELDNYDTLGYAARSCDTFGDALRTLCRYLRVVEDGSHADISQHDKYASLRYELVRPVGGGARQTTELGLCVFHRWGESLLQSHWPLVSVSFSHPLLLDDSEHKRVFSADIQFEQHTNELVFTTDLLASPLDSADSELRAIMEENLQRVEHSLPSDNEWGDATRQCITASLHRGEPSLAAIAGQLGVSTRTLQRRLGEQSTCFADLLDAVRRELASSQLASSHTSVGEVAFALGYSDISAFHHAFKRWYSVTPGQFRNRR